MKLFGNKTNKRIISAFAFVLIMATLMSLMLAFPAAALKETTYSWSDTGKIYRYTGILWFG